MKVLLLDIETAPNTAHVWGMFKQNIGLNQLLDSGYTMCWAAKWLGGRKVMFDSVHKSKPEEMVSRIHSMINEADAVIHYNGTKFDMPTLNKEFLLFDLAPPAPYREIDLLKTARRKFRFPSNKLDYVAKALGLSGKVKHIGHELWIQCMAGNDKAWRMMEKYNKQDVVLLEDVYSRLLPWIDGHPNHGLYIDSETPVCTNCGSDSLEKRGFSFTTLGKYQRYQCKNCGRWGRGKRTLQGVEMR